MIKQVGQIMLYVNNQDEAVNFWTEKAGFQILAEEDNGQGMRWIEVSPSKESETSIILHNKEWVAKMSPGLNLGTPSLMFLQKILKDFIATFQTRALRLEKL